MTLLTPPPLLLASESETVFLFAAVQCGLGVQQIRSPDRWGGGVAGSQVTLSPF